MSAPDFASLEADALDAPGPDAPPAAAAPPIDPAAEWRDAITIAIGMASIPYPELRQVWTADVIAAVASTCPPVAQKYGLSSFGQLMARFPELALIITAGPPLYASAQLVRQRHAAAAAKPVQTEPVATANTNDRPPDQMAP